MEIFNRELCPPRFGASRSGNNELRIKDLGEWIVKNTNKRSVSVPTFFDLSKATEQKKFIDLAQKGKIQFINDDFIEQLKELFQIKNPRLVYHPDFKKEFEKYLSALKNVPFQNLYFGPTNTRNFLNLA